MTIYFSFCSFYLGNECVVFLYLSVLKINPLAHRSAHTSVTTDHIVPHPIQPQSLPETDSKKGIM